MYTEDFFIRHRQLRESADRVVGISKRTYDPENVKLYMNGIDITPALSKDDLITLYYHKRTKLLHSKSKQRRMVRVVCK